MLDKKQIHHYMMKIYVQLVKQENIIYEKQRAFQIPTTMHVQNHSACNTSEYDDNNSLTVITNKTK